MTEPVSSAARLPGLESVLAPASDVRAEVVGGELLLYHPAQTKAIYLNPSAAVIWSLCDGRRNVQEIIQLIGEGYPEARANLVEDVFATLRELCEQRVLGDRGGS